VALVGAWCGGGAVVAWDPAQVLPLEADPFAVPMSEWHGEGNGRNLGFGGGWIGLWGYQVGRRVESLPAAPPRPVPQREHWIARYDWVIHQDPQGQWWFESLLPWAESVRLFDKVRREVGVPLDGPAGYRFGPFALVPGPSVHRAAVGRGLEHIKAGDIFQVNLCARLEASFDGDPLDVFCAAVEALAPPYAAFIDTGCHAVASMSPELFLRRRGRRVVTCPIKGTAPASEDPDVLAASTKNRAENVMIVDLMRNDLSRVCSPGTVHVADLARPQARAGVWHLVSKVTGKLRDGVTDADLLRATFPPGSVTGAPKIRAMELINELESTGRELYTGAIGYVSPVAGLEASVVIRTLEFASGHAWLGVGGGVVADSTPEGELAECLAKARPVLAAIGAELEDVAYDDLASDLAPDDPRTDLPVSLADASTAVRPAASNGVNTTVLVRDGRPILAEAHAERLCASASVVLGVHLDRHRVLAQLRRQASAFPVGDFRLRMSVGPSGCPTVTVRPVTPETTASRLVPVLLPGGLGAHKWSDRSSLAHLPPLGERGSDPLFVDGDDTVLETDRANVFLVNDEGVHTPRLDGRILPGVAREAVLDLLRRRGIPVHERNLTVADLAGAAEVFTTNAVRGVVPVTHCRGVGQWPVGRTTSWLSALLQDRWRVPNQPAAGADAAAAAAAGGHVLLIDNYDSFAYNLARYVQELGARVTVVRNDAHTAAELLTALLSGDLTHLLLSPGPGSPDDAGACVDVIRQLAGRIPVLGVCLGHQCIATAYGARVVKARRPVHGKQSLVHHDGEGLYAGIDGPLVAARYHSLAVEDLPSTLQSTAWTADGTVMGLRHRTHPVAGTQVHPESILTPFGHTLLANFLTNSGRRPRSS
jgi:para-aminobenzoate synthetase/4-amino-4-deoxychorismate lyase